MSKRTLLFIGILLSSLLRAQVGINTRNPEGIFHIDPKGDTNGSMNALDDVLVDNNGNIGFGTVHPAAKIHIKTNGTSVSPKSGFRLVDGNEGEGKYLMTTSNDGLATWKQLSYTEGVNFVKPSSCPDLTVSTNNYYRTNAYITLPRGRWVLMVVMYMAHQRIYANSSCWINTTFADATTVGYSGQVLNRIVTPDIEGSQLISAMAVFDTPAGGTLTGSVLIRNSKPSQTYYFMAGGTVLYGNNSSNRFSRFGGCWGEDNIIAFRIPEDI